MNEVRNENKSSNRDEEWRQAKSREAKDKLVIKNSGYCQEKIKCNAKNDRLKKKEESMAKQDTYTHVEP